MARVGICPTCGNYEQELVEAVERRVEVLEHQMMYRPLLDAVVPDIGPRQYPVGTPGKTGPVHRVTAISCPLGHFITTEDQAE